MDADQIYLDLGKRIKGLRRGLGLTQDKLSKRVGISRASLANIEAGRQQVLVHHLFAFAKALDLESPSHLLLTSKDHPHRDKKVSALPLSGEGLTEKQRHEVLNLMGGVFDKDNVETGKEHA